MQNFNSFMRRAFLLLALAFGAGPALAGPTYHVSVNTSALAGQSGYLDFLFLRLGNSAPAVATLSNFSGAFQPASYTAGDVSGTAASSVSIGNGAGWNEFAQWADFGGSLGFDIGFDVLSAVGAGTTLSVALLDSQFGYLGLSGDIATFALQPGAPDQVSFDSRFAAVNLTAVPEPSTVLLMAIGTIALLGKFRRRQ
jgi:hypothetical protein